MAFKSVHGFKVFFFFSFFHPVRVDTNMTVLMGPACDCKKRKSLVFPICFKKIEPESFNDILWAFSINNNSTHACSR